MLQLLHELNQLLAILFFFCYAYQFVYSLVALCPSVPLPEGKVHRFAVLVAARNEAGVIARLIDSIHQQDYPAGMLDVYVVADNCTDNTAQVAREAGARVWERFDRSQVGKGYALRWLFEQMKAQPDCPAYDGYLIFDADNLLDPGYMTAINRPFSAGYRIVTSYRSSKNYGDNWISAGYSLWFLREARFLNHPRMLLGTSCAVSGTGFLVHHEIIEKNGGWKHFLLTEDIEFTVDSILHGERVGYCHDAIFYDEQPTQFSQSWWQRLRWTKGGFQVFGQYGTRMAERIVRPGCSFWNRFSCLDMLLNMMPAAVLTMLSLIVNTAALVVSLLTPGMQLWAVLIPVFRSMAGGYGLLLLMGGLVLATEWKRIPCPVGKRLLYLLAFPLFMYTYIPISVAALFQKVEWRPIRHSVAKSLEQLRP